MAEETKELELKVAESIQDDVNKGIVKIDSSLLRKIDARPGDIIEIEGERKSVGIADRAYPGDIGLNIIRMDGLIRRNAKTSIGEVVKVRKSDVKEAKKVIIAPARKGILVRASSDAFKNGLLGRPVVKGDIVSLGGARRRRTTMSGSPFFDDIFRMLEEETSSFGFGLSDLKFVVADVIPKGSVIITDLTNVVLNPEAIEIKEETIPEVTYEDIGGLNEELKKVREMIELPLKHPELFESLGIEAPKGVLLHGPPGTGKTLLAKAVANESNSHFILINGPEIMSKFYGQSEENLRNKFEEAEKNAPSIIFIDEVDAIAPKREEVKGEVERRVVAQLLTLMDGLKSRGKVVVIAATNVPNILDPALRRPGRFDRELEIGVPSKLGRLKILKIHTRQMPIIASLYTDILANILSKRKEEISLELSKKNDLIEVEIEKTNKEIKELNEGLTELKKAKSSRDETVVGKVVNIIAQTNKKIEDKKHELDSIKKQKQEIDDKLNKIKRLTEVFKDEKFFNEIIKELSSIEKSIETLGENDPRTYFLKITQNKISEKIRNVIVDLINLGIVEKSIFIQARTDPAAKDRDLKKIAEITYGFVGADLAALAKEAAMIVLRRLLPEIPKKDDEKIPKEILEKIQITNDDFRQALKVVRPSALREVLVEIPNIKWTDIGGLENVKQELIEAVEWPLKYPKAFKDMGIKPPKGILIYGAPGTGKTLLAKAVAKESKANFILVKGPEILSKWVNETPKLVKKLFEKARQVSPAIIFIDEIDSIASGRDQNLHSSSMSAVETLLTEMDGIEEMRDIVIIAATNRPDMIDPALLRSGRFDRIILTPVPDKEGRKKIFEVHTKKMPLTKDVNIDKLADKTDGYVGADIEAICREAAIIALRKDMKAKEVTGKNFEEALKIVRPSVSKEVEKVYEDLKDQFKAAIANQIKDELPSYMG